MIRLLVQRALAFPLWAGAIAAAIVAGGIWAFENLDIEAYPGIADLGMFESVGQPNVEVIPDRALCARNGLNVGDVLGQVQVAIGGQAVTQVHEGKKRFDLTVRWRAPYREDVARLREIPIATAGGASIPLGNLAQVKLEDGPALAVVVIGGALMLAVLPRLVLPALMAPVHRNEPSPASVPSPPALVTLGVV